MQFLVTVCYFFNYFSLSWGVRPPLWNPWTFRPGSDIIFVPRELANLVCRTYARCLYELYQLVCQHTAVVVLVWHER